MVGLTYLREPCAGESNLNAKPETRSPDDKFRQQVLELLSGGNAHLDFEKAVANLPAGLRGKRPKNIPHTPWRVVEHTENGWNRHRRGDHVLP
jgi:hypothetical protein